MKLIFKFIFLLFMCTPSHADIDSINNMFVVSVLGNNLIKLNKFSEIKLHILNKKTQLEPKLIKATITGSMPIHQHGLPTQPKLVKDDKKGVFKIVGLKLNMPGNWQLKIHLKSQQGEDYFILPLRVNF